ncbi:hypothetical protein QTP70_027755, partial [Hemibagrus guttatus]
MDLTSGFYNIVVSEEDRKFTAFTTPMGLYEFNRLPQGLCNSPASFMQLMTNIFGDQNFLTLLCYLDDLLMYTPNEEEAVKRLELMFTRLRWDLGMDDRAAQWLTQGAHQLLSPGLSPLPVFSLRELQEKQQDDKVLSRVLFH